ncbi:hypothetical protein ACFE04_000363 [Oxalis oulophora]
MGVSIREKFINLTRTATKLKIKKFCVIAWSVWEGARILKDVDRPQSSSIRSVEGTRIRAGWLCNIDVAVFSESNASGFGVILKSESDEFIEAFSGVFEGLTEPSMA